MQSGLIICLCSVHICQHVCVIDSGNIVDYMHCIIHVNNIIIYLSDQNFFKDLHSRLHMLLLPLGVPMGLPSGRPKAVLGGAVRVQEGCPREALGVP